MNITVDTAQGQVSGLRADDVASFKGIPFAAPPTGPLRFRPPSPPQPWAGTRDCTGYGPISLQHLDPLSAMIPGCEWNFYSPGATQSENCLNLNVWAPIAALSGPPRAVLMWIHGGAFLAGSGTGLWCDGTNLAGNEDVIVVTVNYRLGALGGLVLDDAGTGANNMLRDQLAALTWIRDNISAFGGNPGRVIIAGESAGAMSIADLLAAPAARGLFHGAIIQSGHGRASSTLATARRRRDGLLAELAMDPSASLLADLQALPADRILDAQQRVAAAVPAPFRPVVDGAFLPRSADETAAAGDLAPVPLLIGTNTNENNLFAAMRWGPGAGDDDLSTRIRSLFRQPGPGTEDTVADLTDVYLKLADSDREAWNIVSTDRDWRGPVRELAGWHSAVADVYQYEFTWATAVRDGELGACHALDIPFTFGNLRQRGVSDFVGSDAAGESARQRVELACRQAWGAFIRAGSPRSEVLPDWPRYGTSDSAVMLIAAEPTVAYAPHADRLDRWAQLAPLTRPPLDL